jgi:hypothetical protein
MELVKVFKAACSTSGVVKLHMTGFRTACSTCTKRKNKKKILALRNPTQRKSSELHMRPWGYQRIERRLQSSILLTALIDAGIKGSRIE